MTRKHFQAIADALRQTDASADTVSAVARALSATNPRFDHERFRRASQKG